MLKVGGVVLSLFQLVLGVLFKLAPDTIDKGLEVSKVFSKKVLELRPPNWSGAFMAALVLGQSEADGATEKSGGKGGTIHLRGA